MKCENDLEWLAARFKKMGYAVALDSVLEVRSPGEGTIWFYRVGVPTLMGSLAFAAIFIKLMNGARVDYALDEGGLFLPEEGPWLSLLEMGARREKVEGGWMVFPPEGWSWEKGGGDARGERYFLNDAQGKAKAGLYVSKELFTFTPFRFL